MASALAKRPAADLAGALGSPRAVLVTGGTGYVGQRLVEALSGAGHRVIVLSRAISHTEHLPGSVHVVTSLEDIASDAKVDAIVSLAGEPLADGLWTPEKRARILNSRLAVAEAVRHLAERLVVPPKMLVTASAIGWYGIRGDEELDETSAGTDCFSRQVCVGIEDAAGRTEAPGVRSVALRIGLVLDVGGGLLGRMLLPFKLGLGGRFGDGQQWMSWIHRDDLVRLICHAIATPELSGPVNATAPTPVRNCEFTRALGQILGRPTFIPVPGGPLKLALGDFARELLLGGQRVLPRAAQASGFTFDYPELSGALRAILKR